MSLDATIMGVASKAPSGCSCRSLGCIFVSHIIGLFNWSFHGLYGGAHPSGWYEKEVVIGNHLRLQ